MKLVTAVVLAAVLIAGGSAAQSMTERTSAGDLKITPIAHGSLVLEFGGKVIHVDPWSRSGPNQQPVDLSGYPKADWIFITDIHGDHFDPKGIEAVRKAGTRIVAPAAVAATQKDAMVINNGQAQTYDGIRVEAVAAYNIVRQREGRPMHEKGRGNGYVFTFGDKRLFVSGDTECVPEIKALTNIDIAFLPMFNGPTMNPQEAAQCAMAFMPRILYAYHYGTDDPKTVQKMLADARIEYRIGAPSGF